MPKVSIIMPCFNAESSIGRAINSVLKQSFCDWELIIVDDQSSDNSSKVVRDFDDKRIKLIENEENLGAGVSRNRGIKEAAGRFIAFLDADDYWHSNKLEKQVNFMLSNSFEFTYHDYQKFSKVGLGGVIRSPNSANYNQLLKTCYIGCLTVMYDTKSLGKRYMPVIRKRQDYGLWLSILKEGVTAHRLPSTLAYYAVDSGMTSNKFKVIKHQWHFYRKHLGFGVIKSLALFPSYAFFGLFKYFR